MKVLLLEGSVLQLVLPESELAAGPVLVQVFGKFLLQFAEQDFFAGCGFTCCGFCGCTDFFGVDACEAGFGFCVAAAGADGIETFLVGS